MYHLPYENSCEKGKRFQYKYNMKRLFYFWIILLVSQVILFSCKSLKNTVISNSMVQTEFYPTDANWSDTLANSSQQVKSAFMKFFGNDLNRINSQLGLSLTKEDFNNLKVLSVETYRIDTAEIKSFNESSSINKMLKLTKTEAECYMLKDSDVVFFMEQKLNKGQWKVTELGRILDVIGNKIKSLYFNENIKVHGVIVGDGKKYNKKKFVVFVRDGKYFSIYFGKEIPLLKELLDYKRNTESGLIF